MKNRIFQLHSHWTADTLQVGCLEELPWDYQPDGWSLKKPLSISGNKEQVSFKGVPWCNGEHSEFWIPWSENWVGPFWLIRTRTLFTPLIGPAFQLPCPQAAWFTWAHQTSVGTTQDILAGPRQLCTSLAIGGPAPALLSIPLPGEQQPSQCRPPVGLPRVLGAKGRGCAPWVLPCEGASYCMSCSHWSDRMAAFQYRVPDLTGKNYVLFRFSIILNINWPYPSLLWFYLEFLAPKSLLGMQNCCLANIWTLTRKSHLLVPAQPKKGAWVADFGIWGNSRSLTHGRRARLLQGQRGEEPLGVQSQTESFILQLLFHREDFLWWWAEQNNCVLYCLGEKYGWGPWWTWIAN